MNSKEYIAGIEEELSEWGYDYISEDDWAERLLESALTLTDESGPERVYSEHSVYHAVEDDIGEYIVLVDLESNEPNEVNDPVIQFVPENTNGAVRSEGLSEMHVFFIFVSDDIPAGDGEPVIGPLSEAVAQRTTGGSNYGVLPVLADLNNGGFHFKTEFDGSEGMAYGPDSVLASMSEAASEMLG